MPAETTSVLDQASEPRRTSRSAVELAIAGMSCNNCARHVAEAIQSVPGVKSALVSLDSHKAVVRWEADEVFDAQRVVKAVEQAGYGARLIEPAAGDEKARTKLATWQITLWVGVLGTAPMMLGEWALNLGMRPWFQWLSFALAGMVQVFAGARFYRGAWSQLKVRSSNMDTLVALGSTAAFGYSTWALLSGQGGHLYFMEAASIITLVSVGHWLESRVSLRASDALRKLLDLAPAQARRRDNDGHEVEVAVADLQVGDLIVLRPGDRIPTDGEVIEGDSTVDEAMLTGESAPVDKTKGHPLYAGTVNLNGRLLMRVAATGDETALAHIIAAVQRAQTSRADIQRLGDRVSNVFVPVVAAVAILAALWWGLAYDSAIRVHERLGHYLWLAQPPSAPLAAAFIIAAAVLIVACPGTLTTGKPAVVRVWEQSRAGVPPAQPAASERKRAEAGIPTALLPLASSLARHSTHPVSMAVAALSHDVVEFEHWEEIRGAGVQGEAYTQTALLGSLRWLAESGVDIGPGKAFVEEWSGQGATIVGMSLGDLLLGLFAVKDALKPGARLVVEQLQKQGLETYMVTGDNSLTAASIARQAGISPENVFAEVRPEQKADFVRKLQQAGKRVAFVGDGINDAPALEQADLGIAVSRASDIAREAADIILLKSEIEAVPESLGLARATLRTIKQNLFWAFFYNAIGVPLAALGFMSPILCAAAMGLSDLVVIGNALRLRRSRRR